MLNIQVTLRCNMTCDHCIWACTTAGDDMTRETFSRAIATKDPYRRGLGTIGQREYPDGIVLGGGEPLMHPDFWDFLEEALKTGKPVHVTTNGSYKEASLRLLNMAKEGRISAHLSRDKFHGRIHPDVVAAFTEAQNGKSIQIRGVEDHHVKKSGRAFEWAGNENMCCCDELRIKPNGDVHFCGCPTAVKLGNVMDKIEYVEMADGGCNRHRNRREV